MIRFHRSFMGEMRSMRGHVIKADIIKKNQELLLRGDRKDSGSMGQNLMHDGLDLSCYEWRVLSRDRWI
jgi:hypothetical protein